MKLPIKEDRKNLSKEREMFFTLEEVAEALDLPQHVLRFWESRFTQIRPLKRSLRGSVGGGGMCRCYSREDVTLLYGLRYLLYTRGTTIRSVQRLLRARGTSFVIALGESVQKGADVQMLLLQEEQTGVALSLLRQEKAKSEKKLTQSARKRFSLFTSLSSSSASLERPMILRGQAVGVEAVARAEIMGVQASESPEHPSYLPLPRDILPEDLGESEGDVGVVRSLFGPAFPLSGEKRLTKGHENAAKGGLSCVQRACLREALSELLQCQRLLEETQKETFLPFTKK